jgi:transposase
MGKTKENQARYYDEVIRLYFEEGLGSLRITHLVPVSRSTILRWIRIFVSENPEYRYQMQKPSTPKHEDPETIEAMRREKAEKAEIRALKEEIGRLQVKLQKAELRADLYDEMINVAEKQFNIPIRKKSGAK